MKLKQNSFERERNSFETERTILKMKHNNFNSHFGTLNSLIFSQNKRAIKSTEYNFKTHQICVLKVNRFVNVNGYKMLFNIN